MKTIAKIFSTMCLLTLLLAALPGPLSAAPTIKSVDGNVSIKLGGKGDWKKASAGMNITKNTTIKTGTSSFAIIMWEQGHVVKIKETTEVDISKLEYKQGGSEKTEIQLKEGKLYANASKLSSENSTFNVKTPTAVAGVRGTEFMVQVMPDNSSVISLVQGQLSVTGDSVNMVLEQNNQIEIGTAMSGPPNPMPLPDDVKVEIESDASTVGTILSESSESPSSEEGSSDDSEVAAESGDTPDEDMAGIMIDPSEIINETITNTIDNILENIEIVIEETPEVIDIPPMPPER